MNDARNNPGPFTVSTVRDIATFNPPTNTVVNSDDRTVGLADRTMGLADRTMGLAERMSGEGRRQGRELRAATVSAEYCLTIGTHVVA